MTPAVVSVIIVSYNCKDILMETATSLLDSGFDNYEMIIVENGDDGGAEHAAGIFPSIKVVMNDRNIGFAAANNKGARLASGDYILLLNPDTIVLPNTIKPMIDFMKSKGGCGICGPKILNSAGLHTTNPCPALSPSKMLSDLFLRRLLRLVKPDSKSEKSCRADFVHGSCMLIKRDVYEALGGLDESLFMYCEEFEFCTRALREGWETWYVSDAEVIHLGEGASDESLRWAIPLRWHSALSVYGRYRSTGWVLALRFTAMLNLLADFAGVVAASFAGKLRGSFSERMRGMCIALLTLLLPVEIGAKFIPVPDKR